MARRDTGVGAQATLALALLGGMGSAPAQVYPAKVLRLVVPYPAGGGVDITARLIAPALGERWGQPVVVENRGGAAGTLGADHVAKALADGYTLLVSGRGPLTTATLTFPQLPYVPTRDLIAVSNLVTWPYILVVHPGVPARTAQQLITLAKTRPGVLNMASGGAGSTQQIAGEWFNVLAGTRMAHIPYKGTAPAINDIVGGHADLGFLDPAVLPQVKAGRLRALGVSSAMRYRALPEVPTLRESGLPNYVSDNWYGMMAPAATARDLLTRISSDAAYVLAQPTIQQRLLLQGLVASPSSPEQFTITMRQDFEQLLLILKATGIQLK